MKGSWCFLLAFCFLLVKNVNNEPLSEDSAQTKLNFGWLFQDAEESIPTEGGGMEDEADVDRLNENRNDRQWDSDDSNESDDDEDGRLVYGFHHKLPPQRFQFAHSYPWTRENDNHHNPRMPENFNKNERTHEGDRHADENPFKVHSPRFGRNPYADIVRRQLHHDNHKSINDLRGKSLLEADKPSFEHNHHKVQPHPQRWNNRMARERLNHRGQHSTMERGFHGDGFYRGPPAEHYKHTVSPDHTREHNDDRNHILPNRNGHRRTQMDSHFPIHSRNPYRDEHHRHKNIPWRDNHMPSFHRHENHQLPHRGFDNSEKEAESDNELENRLEPLVEDKCPKLAEIGSCDFYHCFEAKHSCPVENNFIINVGLRQCETTNRRLGEFSAQGQEYIRRVRQCHMKNLLPVYERRQVPCEHVNKFGLGILTPDTSSDCFFQGNLFCSFIRDPNNAIGFFHVYGGTGIVEYRLLMHFARIIETCDDNTKDIFTENYARHFLADMMANGLSFHNMSQMAEMDRTIEALLQKARAHMKYDAHRSDYRHEMHNRVDHRDMDGHKYYRHHHDARQEMAEHHNLLNSRSPFAQKLLENRHMQSMVPPQKHFNTYRHFGGNFLNNQMHFKPFTLPRVEKLHNVEREGFPHSPFTNVNQPFENAHRILEGIQRARQMSPPLRQDLRHFPIFNSLQKARHLNTFVKQRSPFSRQNIINAGIRNHLKVTPGLLQHGRVNILGPVRMEGIHEINPQYSDVLNIRKQKAGQIMNIRNQNNGVRLLPGHDLRRGQVHAPVPRRTESKSPYALQRHQAPGLVMVPLMRGL